MSDSTFDLSFDSELDEFDPLEDTGADDDENEGGDYTAISSATDVPAQQLEAESDNRTPAERIDDLFKSMAPRRKVLLGILSFVQEPQTAEAVNAHVDELQQDNFSVYTAANLCNLLERAGVDRIITLDRRQRAHHRRRPTRRRYGKRSQDRGRGRRGVPGSRRTR